MQDPSVLDRLLRCGRRSLLVAALACLAAPAASAGETPAIRAKRAEAKQVLAQIASIDESLSVVTERYDGARVHLTTIQGRLKAERASLAQARAANQHAQQAVADLVVHLYESGHPSALEAILGADTVEGMITASDNMAAVATQDRLVAEAAERARTRLEHAVHALRSDQAGAARTVKQLDRSKSIVEAGLAERQKLLKRVQGQVAHLEAVQRAWQEHLAALARARLAAERRAQARAAAAAAAAEERRIEAARVAVTPPTTTTTTTTTPQILTVPDATTTLDPSALAPTVLPAGHPQAATIALGYIGTPYLWGGSTPAGFDCSGLVSYVFAQLGILLPHFAADQYTFGVPVPLDELQAGDLVFFDNLDHVGIYIGGGEFVDAPHTGTFVRIDNLSDGWYAKRYVGARRI